MRHNRSHRGNVRSHHALKNPRARKCADCGAVAANHRVCALCGKYKGKVVIDVHAKLAKKDKKNKAKTKAEK